MSQSVPLAAIPNQSFSVRLADSLYDITVRSSDGIMVVDIARDTVLIVEGMRALAGVPLLPYRHLESGNFVFFTANNELPDYNQFNVTQELVYFDAEALASFRAAPLAFDPNGALPFRYQVAGRYKI